MFRLHFTKSLLLVSAFTCYQVNAEMKPMDDTAMEATVGQAYIVMDSNTDVPSGNQFSRITFGQEIKVQANADSLVLGDITDAGHVRGIGTDFSANNLSLGYIDTATNTIVPFEFTNPYFEWVTDASNNMVGFRVGAEQTKGRLQADITSFSGNIIMQFDTGGTKTLGNLYSAAGAITPTNNRATMLGSQPDSCVADVNCFSLDKFQSLDVADSDGSSTGDFFLSFQKETTNWLLSGGGTQSATKGFFMNIPTNNVITVSGASTGTAGYAVEFIDRGVVNGGTRWNNP